MTGANLNSLLARVISSLAVSLHLSSECDKDTTTAIVLAFVLENDDIFYVSSQTESIAEAVSAAEDVPRFLRYGSYLQCSQTITHNWIWLTGYTPVSCHHPSARYGAPPISHNSALEFRDGLKNLHDFHHPYFSRRIGDGEPGESSRFASPAEHKENEPSPSFRQ